ncbi:MAG: NUDIX hydrolase [Candidatus Doudnabacteria bacterium]|nr:NUDIX hydrolase [bacterium]MDZ4244215.1 NUDIX hydrolase [Candidatus Doudnabacteria bacterium]
MSQKEIGKKLVFEGKLFRIWQSENEFGDGRRATYEYTEHKNGSVAAVVLDDNQNIYLTKEFRVALDQTTVNLPAGGFDPKKETPENAIVRELREEIGKKPNRVEKLFNLQGGGSWIWPQYFFLCTDLKNAPLAGDWDEDIEVIKMPFREYLTGILSGKASRHGDFKAAILTAKKLGLIELKQ